MENISVISQGDNSTVVGVYESSVERGTGYQSEAELEKELIELLQRQAYEYLDIHSESELIINLKMQLEKLNNIKFSENEWNQIWGIINNKNANIQDKAYIIQKDYIHVITLDNGSSKNIYFIDKQNIHNNILQVINQYEVNGVRKNIYDVTILINGFPMVHIELKRRGMSIREAFNQIKRYQRESFWTNSGLYEYIQIFIISNGTETKYYSNTTRYFHTKKEVNNITNTFEFTSFWADQRNNKIADIIDFAKTFLSRHSLLNIICKYCVFTADRNLMVMRPYQIVATEKIINRISVSYNNKLYGTQKAGGYIWHTTGSGKTLTSFKTAQIARELEYIDRVIFVVDRKDLDYQTMKEYEEFEKGSAYSNTTTAKLAKQLQSSDNKIIITTIQKLSFLTKKDLYLDIFNQHVVFIFDECHRSQFGDMHKRIIQKFKKYYLFGFTGTPIFKINATSKFKLDQTTAGVFGDELHNYTILNAINDKNVLRFKYDYISTIKVRDDVEEEQVKAIDIKSALEHEERVKNVVEEIIRTYHKKTLNKSLETYDYRVLENTTEVARDNKIQEVKRTTKITGFNSIFATSSINMAKKYYEEFKKQNHDLKISLIYSYGPNDDPEEDFLIVTDENSDSTEGLSESDRDFLDNAIIDYNQMFGTTYDTSAEKFSGYYKDVSLRMKNKEIDILIVVNMFLTGFDAKVLNTLWVDKNLKYHSLIQAFSRTNRILNSVKTHGNIVCFRNLEDDLNDALLLYGDTSAQRVVLIRPLEDYLYGYEDKGIKEEGYFKLIDELEEEYKLGFEIVGEENEKRFITLFGKILKMKNFLSQFDEFEEVDTLNIRDFQDYQSIYLSIKEEYDRRKRVEGESILEDIVFENELMLSIDINVDYILTLIKKYNDTGKQDEEKYIDIRRAILSSPELRNKIDLIQSFIDSLDGQSNVYEDFTTFMENRKREELNYIIKEENLNPDETYKFVEKSFKNGEVSEIGEELTKIIPPVSRFDQGNALTIKKQTVLQKLIDFFNRFFNITGSRI